MGAIERYIFRTAGGAFLATLIALTGVIWVTQALARFNLITAQGQTLWIFLRVTGLSIPVFLLIIAPIALFVATAFTLSRLNGDFELVAMGASTLSPWRLFKPFAALGLLVALAVGWLAMQAAPQAQRSLRAIIAEIRSDVVTNIIRPGRFNALEQGITFHIRDRTPAGVLQGIVVEDSRTPEQIYTYLAEQGAIVTVEGAPYLLLENGVAIRRERTARNADVVEFQSYAIDLSQFGATPGNRAKQNLNPAERSMMELLRPAEDDATYRASPLSFAAEVHQRFSVPLYPVAFVLIAYGLLGQVRTTRQSRLMPLVAAVLIVAVDRALGFVATQLINGNPKLALIAYLPPLAGIVIGLVLVQRMQHPNRGWTEMALPRPAFLKRFAGPA